MSNWKARLRRWLPGGRDRFRDEINEEIREHIERITQANIASYIGVTPETLSRIIRKKRP